MEIVLFDKMEDKFHFIPCDEENFRSAVCDYLSSNSKVLAFAEQQLANCINRITGTLSIEEVLFALADVDFAAVVRQ